MVIKLRTIQNFTYTTTIQKSKFICKLISISDFEEIDQELKKAKQEYKDATHYCYCYIYDHLKRFSDDKEPSKTAGMPMLNVLEKHHLNHVLCIVIRYFGGIKLGAGGLVRAYTKAVTNCLDNTTFLELKKGKLIQIEFDYEKTKVIDSLIGQYIVKKEFDRYAIYQFSVCDNELNEIINLLKNIVIKLEILKDIYIKTRV